MRVVFGGRRLRRLIRDPAKLKLREAAAVRSRLFLHYAQQLARLGAFAFGVAAAAAETLIVNSRARAARRFLTLRSPPLIVAICERTANAKVCWLRLCVLRSKVSKANESKR